MTVKTPTFTTGTPRDTGFVLSNANFNPITGFVTLSAGNANHYAFFDPPIANDGPFVLWLPDGLQYNNAGYPQVNYTNFTVWVDETGGAGAHVTGYNFILLPDGSYRIDNRNSGISPVMSISAADNLARKWHQWNFNNATRRVTLKTSTDGVTFDRTVIDDPWFSGTPSGVPLRLVTGSEGGGDYQPSIRLALNRSDVEAAALAAQPAKALSALTPNDFTGNKEASGLFFTLAGNNTGRAISAAENINPVNSAFKFHLTQPYNNSLSQNGLTDLVLLLGPPYGGSGTVQVGVRISNQPAGKFTATPSRDGVAVNVDFDVSLTFWKVNVDFTARRTQFYASATDVDANYALIADWPFAGDVGPSSGLTEVAVVLNQSGSRGQDVHFAINASDGRTPVNQTATADGKFETVLPGFVQGDNVYTGTHTVTFDAATLTALGVTELVMNEVHIDGGTLNSQADHRITGFLGLSNGTDRWSAGKRTFDASKADIGVFTNVNNATTGGGLLDWGNGANPETSPVLELAFVGTHGVYIGNGNQSGGGRIRMNGVKATATAGGSFDINSTNRGGYYTGQNICDITNTDLGTLGTVRTDSGIRARDVFVFGDRARGLVTLLYDHDDIDIAGGGKRVLAGGVLLGYSKINSLAGFEWAARDNGDGTWRQAPLIQTSGVAYFEGGHGFGSPNFHPRNPIETVPAALPLVAIRGVYPELQSSGYVVPCMVSGWVWGYRPYSSNGGVFENYHPASPATYGAAKRGFRRMVFDVSGADTTSDPTIWGFTPPGGPVEWIAEELISMYAVNGTAIGNIFTQDGNSVYTTQNITFRANRWVTVSTLSGEGGFLHNHNAPTPAGYLTAATNGIFLNPRNPSTNADVGQAMIAWEGHGNAVANSFSGFDYHGVRNPATARGGSVLIAGSTAMFRKPKLDDGTTDSDVNGGFINPIPSAMHIVVGDPRLKDEFSNPAKYYAARKGVALPTDMAALIEMADAAFMEIAKVGRPDRDQTMTLQDYLNFRFDAAQPTNPAFLTAGTNGSALGVTPPGGFAVVPSSITLGCGSTATLIDGQTLSLAPVVGPPGVSQAVDYTISPAVGTINGGNVYSPPTQQTNTQTITITARPSGKSTPSAVVTITVPSNTPTIRVLDGVTPIANGNSVAVLRQAGVLPFSRYLYVDNGSGAAAGGDNALTGLSVSMSPSASWLTLSLNQTTAGAVLTLTATSPSSVPGTADPDVTITVSSAATGVVSRTFVVPGIVAPAVISGITNSQAAQLNRIEQALLPFGANIGNLFAIAGLIQNKVMNLPAGITDLNTNITNLRNTLTQLLSQDNQVTLGDVQTTASTAIVTTDARIPSAVSSAITTAQQNSATLVQRVPAALAIDTSGRVTSSNSNPVDLTGIARTTDVTTAVSGLATTTALTTALTSTATDIKSHVTTTAVPLSKTSDLTPIAKTSDLAVVAKTTDLTPIAKASDLLGIAKVSDLTPIAKTSDLSPIAKTSDLGSLATVSSVSAVSSAIQAHVDTAVQPLATATGLTTIRDAIGTRVDAAGSTTAAAVAAHVDTVVQPLATTTAVSAISTSLSRVPTSADLTAATTGLVKSSELTSSVSSLQTAIATSTSTLQTKVDTATAPLATTIGVSSATSALQSTIGTATAPLAKTTEVTGSASSLATYIGTTTQGLATASAVSSLHDTVATLPNTAAITAVVTTATTPLAKTSDLGSVTTTVQQAATAAGQAANSATAVHDLFTSTRVEPSAAPPVTGYTLVDALQFNYAVARNPRATTTTNQTVFKSDGTTPLHVTAINDNGSVLTEIGA